MSPYPIPFINSNSPANTPQFIEEQAIDRVHRIGQTSDVVIYKLTIVNSVEERILKLQDAKRMLSKAAIGDGAISKKKAKLGFEDLMFLFNRAAEHGDSTEEPGIRSVFFSILLVLRSFGDKDSRGDRMLTNTDTGRRRFLRKLDLVLDRCRSHREHSWEGGLGNSTLGAHRFCRQERGLGHRRRWLRGRGGERRRGIVFILGVRGLVEG